MFDIARLSTVLPNEVTLKAVQFETLHPEKMGDESYVNLVLQDAGVLDGTFDGYCMDGDRPIDLEIDWNFNGKIEADEVGQSYSAKVYSSYEPLPEELTAEGVIEKPENLDLLNWVINQNFAGQISAGGDVFTFADVQRAIWSLIDDAPPVDGGFTGPDGYSWTQAKVDEIVAAALENGEGFVPEFGQKIGVILVPDDINKAGTLDTQIMFAAVELSKLGDKVFQDTDGDGIQDEGESGIQGVTVNLLADLDGDGVIETDEVVDTTTTDADGNYDFTVVGGNYKVQFETPDGYIASAANQGTDDSVDSDGILSDVVTLSPGEYDSTIDSGFFKTAELGDRVFHDTNANGIQDAGESGIAGATVTLLQDGQVIDTATTDANGHYHFTDLLPGDYHVEFATPDGFDMASPANQGGNDAKDSDGPLTATITLAPGESNLTIDSGFFKKAGLGDFVFSDTNQNGLQDEGESGVSGVDVQLLDSNGSVIDTTTTNSQGGYSFNDLMPGDYQVKFVSPDGYVFTNANAGNDALDSDADVTNGLTQTVTLTSGEFNGTLDAGLVELASLGDRVWYDTNGNGIQDREEAGVAGVTVKLTSPDLANAFEVTTDAEGNYKFEDLTPGEYQVAIVTDTLPEGYELTTPNQGSDDQLDSDANPATGLMATTTLSAGENDMSHDAGIIAKKASLGDRVWYDTNRDGIQDDGEQGVKGAKVTLTGGGADGIIGTADDTTAKTVTDANGTYRFDQLNAGEEYKVTFSLPQSNGITNLVENGSFEQNNTAQDRWSVESGLNGWHVTQGRGIEVQELYQHFGAADEGQSWVELDGYDNTGILQQVDTQAGQTYELSFAYAPRPGVSAASNTLEVYWNGELIDTISESGIGHSNSQWNTYTYDVEASEQATTGLEFRGAGRSDGLGAFLDDVQLVTSAQSTQMEVGNELKGGGTVDGWRSIMVVNETDTYTNQSGLTQTINLSAFNFNAAKIGAPVTPFVALVNGDNDFTVLEIGTSRTDYSLGNNSVAFSEGETPEVTLQAGQTLAIGFLDANADGSGSEQSAVRFSYGSDELWLTGGWSGSDSGKVEVGAAPIAGRNVHLHHRRDYQFGIDFEVETGQSTQMQLGNDLKGGGVVDGWHSNLVVNESDIYTNQSGLAQTISLSSFNFNAAKTGAPVTPFVALVNGDNDFTILEVGTSRTDYSIGENSFAFSDSQTPEVTLQSGQTLAIGFLDANADGSGSQHSAVRFSYGGDEIWYSGGWATSHAAKVEAGAAPTAGYRTLTHLNRDYQFGIDFEVDATSIFEFTQQNVGDDGLDSDANPVNGMSQIVTLQPGEHNSTIDAGIVEKLGTVGGQVWHDRHPNDGIQNINDLNYEAGGFSNVVVKLHTVDGTVIDSTLTTTAGFYHFDQVGSGSYYVSFDASTNVTTKSKLDGTTQFTGVPGQRGWSFTAVFNAGTDDARDSDVISGRSTQVAQRTGVFNLHTGEVNKTIGTAITPIAFDLNGDGIQTLSIHDGVVFDMHNTGSAINTGWLSGNDGFLAIDTDGDGLISSRAELFGGATVGSGFAKLESFDVNGDGVVNSSDARFAELKLWQDANENGFTDKGELLSLDAAGITDLSTAYRDVFATDAQGNIHGEVSTAMKSGSTIDMTDVYFQTGV